MNFGHFFPPARTHLYVSTPYFPPLLLFLQHSRKHPQWLKSDKETETESVSGLNPQPLWHPSTLFLCPVSSTARQRYASILPCAQLSSAQLSSAPCSAQMSTQFTAHTKLDHFSGVLCRPRTCCSPPSLIND